MTEERIAVITDGSLLRDSPFAHRVIPFYVTYQTDQPDPISIKQDEISTEDFLEIQRACKKPPGTAQPSPIDFLTVYQEMTDEGYNRFLVLTVPASKSGTYNSAMLAVNLFREEKSDVVVEVIDTGTTAAGVEYLAQEATALAEQGEIFDHIVHRMERLAGKVELFLALDKIDYITASGRIEELASHKLRETLKHYARNLAAWFARRTHHSPKLALTLMEGKEKIVGISRTFQPMVAAICKEVEKRVEMGKGIKKIYLYQRESSFETGTIVGSLLGHTQAEIIEREVLPIALLSITGPKYVAMIIVYD